MEVYWPAESVECTVAHIDRRTRPKSRYTQPSDSQTLGRTATMVEKNLECCERVFSSRPAVLETALPRFISALRLEQQLRRLSGALRTLRRRQWYARRVRSGFFGNTTSLLPSAASAGIPRANSRCRPRPLDPSGGALAR